MTKENLLLSEDLEELLAQFPNDVLRDIVKVLRSNRPLIQIPAPRAYDAHFLGEDGDFSAYVGDIAQEIRWLGSHEIVRQFAGLPDYKNVVLTVASSIGLPSTDRRGDSPTWAVEESLLRKVCADWEKLAPEKRVEILEKAGSSFGPSWAGIVGGAGGLLAIGGDQLAALLARVGGAFFLRGFLGPAAGVFGLLWASHSFLGPGLKVLSPIVLTIAFTRRRLRDERLANAFKD